MTDKQIADFEKTVSSLKALKNATDYSKRVGMTTYIYKTARGWKWSVDKIIANSKSATVLEVNP